MDYLNIFTALVTSIGGASVIILGLSKFFGDFFANRLLGNVKNKHERDLEGIKSRYQRELEETKAELERTKLLFTRYSEKQFSIYNALWGNLLYTRKQLDDLWQNPLLDKLPGFNQQVIQARTAIDDNMLLIESADFSKLSLLMQRLEAWSINGVSLIDMNGLDVPALQSKGLTDNMVQIATASHSTLQADFRSIVAEVGDSFRNQIKG
ncbi:hypothetical protein DNI29_19570 [Hymenobacter sediminis]|uniref:hypothetical protein n=1 Tax=Hymenobacter sediminis TaxID=2218621 RepID=UPI000F5034B9|nr:hypothetical protein [Hymenobacter sediminis]RPD44902.1 hypothetical protein DNI29_19570 [Hymenobacter sediminis]